MVECGRVGVVVDEVEEVRMEEVEKVLAKVEGPGAISMKEWGSDDGGGDCSAVQQQLSADVQFMCSGKRAFAAFKSDGSVV